MFSQPPDDDQQNSNIILQNNPRRRRKKKFSRKNKQQGVRKDSIKPKQSRLAVSMSSWAESFTTAATWQLKHQIAYWKSKAKALEYENNILHEIIKKNYINSAQPETSLYVEESSVKSNIAEKSELHHESAEEVVENEDFEVSEEFIQFLKTNAKYKEDARRERETLRAKQELEENLTESLEAGPSENHENTQEKLKELYGKDWQRIAALEMTVQCNFINKTDIDRPMYWPNIPFNFNFS